MIGRERTLGRKKGWEVGETDLLLLGFVYPYSPERRDVDGTVPDPPSHVHARSILLGAIGNAGDPLSVGLLAAHAAASDGGQDGGQPTLSARKVALKGLGGVATPESAQAIRDVVEDTSASPYLRQLAVQIYRGHPHGNEDLSHLIETRCGCVCMCGVCGV